MKRNFKKYFVVSLVIVVLLGIFAGIRIKQLKNVPTVEAGAGFPVETVTARRGSVSTGLSYVGTVDPWQEIDLAPRISARILSAAGKEGDTLEVGQTAVTLDNGDLKGKINTLAKRVQTAKVNLDYWDSQVRRYQTLVNEGAIAEQDFQKIIFSRDTAQSGYEEAQAALQEARISLDNSIIRSPMTGTVITVHSQPGDMAVPGKPILTVADISRLKVTVKVVEEDLIKIKKGTPVTLSPGGSAKQYPAQVMEILPALDKTVRTGSVEIAVPEKLMKDYSFKPGMSINVSFVLGQRHNAVIVPKQTIKTEGNNTYLFVVRDGKAARKTVTTGISNDNFVEIRSGLDDGEEVISSGLTEIYDGRPLYLTGEKGQL